MRLPLQDWMTWPETVSVMRALGGEAGEARFVGGVVRDTLLGRPVGDIDIATVHTPEESSRRLVGAGIAAHPTGIEHGTVTAVANHRPFEVTTLRRDVETDGRRAIVAFTTDWREDAARRDFTMNALYLDADGTVVDFFGGIEDARAGYVRFVGDAETRIREDVLRILRFFRFHAHHGRGDPDPVGLAACRTLAHLLPTLSGERVQKEILRLLDAPDPRPALEAMTAAGVWEPLLGGGVDLGTLAALDRLDGGSPIALRRLGALVGAVDGALDGDRAEAVATRLRLGNAERRRLVSMTAEPADLDADDRSVRAAIYGRGVERWRDRVLITAARAGAEQERLDRLLAVADGWPVPTLPIAGRDLLALGLDPGERVGKILGRVERWWIDGDFQADRTACLDQAARLIGEDGYEL